MTIQDLTRSFRRHFNFNPPLDMLMTARRGPHRATIDVMKLDEEFAKRDPEYVPNECTYKGRPGYSLSQYLDEKYGREAHDLVSNNI